MSLASKGLIEANDYNQLSYKLDRIWGTGNGFRGWGQAGTLGNVAGGSTTVTAAQWTSLFTRTNSIGDHMAYGKFTSTYPVSGDLLSANTTITARVDSQVAANYGYDIYNSLSTPINYNTNTVTSGQTRYWLLKQANVSAAPAKGIRYTFGSADQARYFFNAGGYLQCYYAWAWFASNSSYLNRGYAAAQGTYFNTITFKGNTVNDPRNISNQSTNTNASAGTGALNGFYRLSSYGANVLIANCVPTNYTSAYTSGDTWGALFVNVSGSTGTNNGKGDTVTFWYTGSAGLGSYTNSNDDVGLFDNITISVGYPSTSYGLSNTWGAVTITQV